MTGTITLVSEAESDKKTGRLDPAVWLDTYGDYLYNYAYSRLRDQSAAEDAVQETFVAALRSRDSFQGASSERTWLVGILRHKIVDHLRRLFRDRAGEPDRPLPAEQENVFVHGGRRSGDWHPERVPGHWSADPENLLRQKEFQRVLDRCLEALPVRLAACFTLYEMEGLGTDEICKELQITPTNLWVMLHRTRRQLRRCLELNWFGGDAAPTRGENK